MDSYLEPLILQLRAKQMPEEAVKQSKYLRNKFSCLGIKSPEKKDILKKHLLKYGKPDKSKLSSYVRYLYSLPEREFHHTAINLYEKTIRQIEPDDIEDIEYMIVTHSWWDTVDTVQRLTRSFFAKYPELIEKHTGKWIEADNFWLQRSAIIFQLHYKDKTDKDLLFKYVLRRKDSDEFFVQKAIGWALRQYGKTNPEAVKQFVEQNKLAPLSEREAMKIINKR